MPVSRVTEAIPMAMPSADNRLRLRPASKARQSQNSRSARRIGHHAIVRYVGHWLAPHQIHQPQLHCPLRRLVTGSCRAAREAGSQLKKSPVSRAAGMVQRVASQGTAAGKLGQISAARATRA